MCESGPQRAPGGAQFKPRFIYRQSVDLMCLLEICNKYVGVLHFLDFQGSQGAPLLGPISAPPGTPPGGPKVRKSPKISKFHEIW